MMQGRQQLPNAIIRFPEFNANSTLPCRRQRQIRVNRCANTILKSQPDQASARQNDGVELTAIKLGQSRIDVTPQKPDLQIGSVPTQLTAATQARGT